MSSTDAASRFCNRPRSTPNPYTKGVHAGKDTLPFVSATYHVCVTCRSWFRCADMDTAQREALCIEMHSHAEKRNKHLSDVQAYEHKVNDSPHGRISRSDLGTGRTVSAVSSESIRRSSPLGVFWPEVLFKARTSREIPESKVVMSKGVRGIMRDDEHGCTAGCWKLEHVSSHEIQDNTGLLSSGTALREGQLNDVFQRAASSLTYGVKRKEVGDTDDGEIWCPPWIRKGCQPENSYGHNRVTEDPREIGWLPPP